MAKANGTLQDVGEWLSNTWKALAIAGVLFGVVGWAVGREVGHADVRRTAQANSAGLAKLDRQESAAWKDAGDRLRRIERNQAVIMHHLGIKE